MRRWKITVAFRTAAGGLREHVETREGPDARHAESIVVRLLLLRQPGAEIIGTEIEEV